jgi:hypothetical protein
VIIDDEIGKTGKMYCHSTPLSVLEREKSAVLLKYGVF